MEPRPAPLSLRRRHKTFVVSGAAQQPVPYPGQIKALKLRGIANYSESKVDYQFEVREVMSEEERG